MSEEGGGAGLGAQDDRVMLPRVELLHAIPPVPPAGLRAESLTLCTLMNERQYARLTVDGVIRGEPTGVEPAFLRAYGWLAEQARRRVPGAGGTPPVWFWVHLDADETRARARKASLNIPATVLLTCQIERDRCLISHFHGWHAVINGNWLVPGAGWQHDPGDAELADWSRHSAEVRASLASRLASAGVAQGDLDRYPPDVRADLVRSWEQIFVLDLWSGEDEWQATVEEVRPSDVVSAVRLIAPPHPEA